MPDRRPMEDDDSESRVTSSARTDIQFTQKLRFYNPGPRFQDTLRYDLPYKMEIAGKPQQTVQGMLPITAESQSFFDIPQAVMLVNEESGNEDTATLPGIYTRIMSQLRERGVVLVEAKRHRSRQSDPNVASTEAEAKKLGAELYDQFMREKAQEWFRIVSEAKSMHAVPNRASGVYAQALKHLHLADPADSIDVIEHERKAAGSQKETNAEVSELKAQLARLEGMLMGKMGAQVPEKVA